MTEEQGFSIGTDAPSYELTMQLRWQPEAERDEVLSMITKTYASAFAEFEKRTREEHTP
jgi:hypothetical protein